MSKTIQEAAKQCQKWLEESYGVYGSNVSVRMWASTETWELCCYGKCPDGSWVLGIMFDDDDVSTEFTYSTKFELEAHLLRIMSFPE